jgi:hypothetical protein
MIRRMRVAQPAPKRQRSVSPTAATTDESPSPSPPPPQNARARARREWTPAAYVSPVTRPFTLDRVERALRLRMACASQPRLLDRLDDDDDVLAFNATALLYFSRPYADPVELVLFEMRLYDTRLAWPQFRVTTMLEFLRTLSPSLAPLVPVDGFLNVPFEWALPLVANRSLAGLRGGTATVDYAGFGLVARFVYRKFIVEPHVERYRLFEQKTLHAVDPRLAGLRPLVAVPRGAQASLSLENALKHAPPCMARAFERLERTSSMGYNATYALVAYCAALGVPQDEFWAHATMLMRRGGRTDAKIKEDSAGYKNLFKERRGIGCARVRQTKGLSCMAADIEDIGAACTACAAHCGVPPRQRWSPAKYARLRSAK